MVVVFEEEKWGVPGSSRGENYCPHMVEAQGQNEQILSAALPRSISSFRTKGLP